MCVACEYVREGRETAICYNMKNMRPSFAWLGLTLQQPRYEHTDTHHRGQVEEGCGARGDDARRQPVQEAAEKGDLLWEGSG